MGAWAEEGEADDQADDFKIRMEDAQLFGPLLTEKYLINVLKFLDEHVEGRVVELLHVVLNGRNLGGGFDMCSWPAAKSTGRTWT